MVDTGTVQWGNINPTGSANVQYLAVFNDALYFAATDGVTGVVPEADLLEVCTSHPDPQACAEEVVNLALDRGSRDNCTCAVIAFEWAGDGTAPQRRPERKWWEFWK